MYEQLNSEILARINANKDLEEKSVKLEKAQTMSEHYSWRNNIELAGIPNCIRDIDLEKLLLTFVKSMELTVQQWMLKHATGFLLVMPKPPKTLTNIKSKQRKYPERLLQIKNDKLYEL